MDRHCESCGTTLTSTSAKARFCGSTCRSRAHRSGAAAPPAPPVDLNSRRTEQQSSAPIESGTVAQVRARLAAVGRLDTWEGQAALDLAIQIANSTVDTLSARSAANRELREAMAAALRGVDTKTSAVQGHRDELQRRREARTAATG